MDLLAGGRRRGRHLGVAHGTQAALRWMMARDAGTVVQVRAVTVWRRRG